MGFRGSRDLDGARVLHPNNEWSLEASSHARATEGRLCLSKLPFSCLGLDIP